MMKRIIAIVLSALLAVGLMPTALAADGIASVSGNVTISVESEAAEGTPVLLVVVPAILDEAENGEMVDVTEATIADVADVDELIALDAEHVAATKVENGKITYECVMSDALPTGTTYIFATYLGAEEIFLLGTFEHVGVSDITSLIEALNDAEADEYYSIIYEDTYGSEEITEPVKVLEKSSADLEYYFGISDSLREDFDEILFDSKPEDGFDLPLFVEKFNATSAWIRLRAEEDTLGVIEAYNNDYWVLPVEEGSDFDSLSRDEKANVLAAVKAGKYSDSETLESDFAEFVVIGLFKMASTREDIEAIIDEDGIYAEYFEGVREIIAEEDLSKYEKSVLFNNVLEKSSNCDDIEEIEKLFKDSVPEEEKKSSSSGSVSATGGYKGKVDAELTSEADEKLSTRVPFNDVEKGHWAEGYIETLYNDGVINGIDKKTFAPSAAILRQDFVKILVGALGYEKVEDASIFTDVKEDAYYKTFVMTAYANNLISGITENEFGITSSISRQDAALIMARVLESKGVAAKAEANFADSAEIADYAKDAVETVVAAGIFGGDDLGNFNPEASLSRAETCAIIFRLLDEIKGE